MNVGNAWECASSYVFWLAKCLCIHIPNTPLHQLKQDGKDKLPHT